MTKDSETPKTNGVDSNTNQTGRHGFINGLNERLRILMGIQQSHEEGYIQLAPETNQAIEAEIAQIKRNAEKMEKQFDKIDTQKPKSTSQTPPKNSGRN